MMIMRLQALTTTKVIKSFVEISCGSSEQKRTDAADRPRCSRYAETKLDRGIFGTKRHNGTAVEGSRLKCEPSAYLRSPK
jgi:hypothetical protein